MQKDTRMIRVTRVAGNVRSGACAPLEGRRPHRLRLPRGDLQKHRMRREADTGADIVISLETGEHLRDGDVMVDGDDAVVVEQLPELVIAVRPEGAASPRSLILIGHAIGNLHRPVSIRGDTIYLPAQAESEAALFEDMLGHAGRVGISMSSMVFKPDPKADISGHG